MSYQIEGKTGTWEVVIGLEVHAQVVSNSKLFSGAATEFGAEPNTQVSLVDAAMPGMLPVVNEEAIRQAVRTGLGLNAAINLTSVFERKNYFYPDLPFGYQISQYQHPIVGTGEIELDMPDGSTRVVGIERLHLEQDAGKSLHDQDATRTFIDLNRAGVALMEIVSKPDLRSPEEAGAYLRKLRAILRYLGTCDGNMEQGSLRCDANVSVRKPGEGLRTRCEIKNVNSIRFVMQAIEIEAERQIDLYENGGKVDQETRLYDPDKQETRSMRSKEEAHDYRYFPDPDLLPIVLEPAFVEELKKALPELPDAKKTRFIESYGLSQDDAALLVSEKELAAFYETVAGKGGDPKLAANWTINDLGGLLNKRGLSIGDSPVSAENLAKLVALIVDKTISSRIAKEVFEEMVASGGDPAKIVADKGLTQITDTGAIEAAVDKVIAENPTQAEQYKSGNQKVAGWFVGQVMKATGGKANPPLVNELLKKKLGG